MPISRDDIPERDLGPAADPGSDVYVDAAIASARALAEREPGQARWVKPLVRAIRRRRLELPTLPPTVERVVKLIEENEVDVDELADAVSGDPALATRIMGVANSSYFRGASEVPSVREALMRMGIREARTIVIVVALRSTLLRAPGVGDAAHRIWRHSLLTASAAQEITLELPPWQASGFLAGLLHDIGQLVILAFVSQLAAWEDDETLLRPEAVDAIRAATHEALGAMVLASWGFPPAFCEAVYAHHDATRASGAAAPLAQAIELADRLAHQVEAGWPEAVAEIAEPLCALGARLGLSPERLADVAGEAEANLEALVKLS